MHFRITHSEACNLPRITSHLILKYDRACKVAATYTLSDWMGLPAELMLVIEIATNHICDPLQQNPEHVGIVTF